MNEPRQYGTDSPSHHDAAIWHALRILTEVNGGRLHLLPDISTSFSLTWPAERVVAEGRYTLEHFHAVGDGSYLKNGGWFVGGGALGVALMVGTAANRVIGSAVRKRRAPATTSTSRSAAAACRWTRGRSWPPTAPPLTGQPPTTTDRPNTPTGFSDAGVGEFMLPLPEGPGRASGHTPAAAIPPAVKALYVAAAARYRIGPGRTSTPTPTACTRPPRTWSPPGPAGAPTASARPCTPTTTPGGTSTTC